MNILILGGSGFVGTWLIEQLRDDGHTVRIGDIACSEKYPELWQKCDVGNEEELFRACTEMEVIVNLAAAHRDDVKPESLYEITNVQGAECVCRAAARARIQHIVFTSSVAVYGLHTNDCREEAEKNPFNEYGKSKLRAEQVYERWQKDVPERMLHIVRPTVIFGEGNRGNIYNLFHQMAVQRFIMIGNGTNRKSMAYVGNVAAFLQWNIEVNKLPYSVYNYVDKPDLNMKDLVIEFEKNFDRGSRFHFSLPYSIGLLGGYSFDFLAWVLRRQLPISSIRIKKFCAQTVFNADKARQVGFLAPYSLEEALRRTIKFEFK